MKRENVSRTLLQSSKKLREELGVKTKNDKRESLDYEYSFSFVLVRTKL